MKTILWLMLCLSALTALARDPREWMEEGFNHLRSQELKAADKAFGEAAQAAPEYELEAAVPLYNQALTKLIGTNVSPEEISQSLNLLRQAERTTDRDLQARVHYTQGLASTHLAETSLQQQDLDSASKLLENALESFTKSMLLAPEDLDAKQGFEITDELKKKVEQLKQQQQEQQQQNQQDQQQQEQQDQNDKQDQKDNQQPQDQKDQQPQPDEKNQENQQDQQKGDDQAQQNPQQDQPQDQQDSSNEEARPPRPMNQEQLDQQQAQALMDAMKEEEEARRAQLRLNLGQTVPVDKDW